MRMGQAVEGRLWDVWTLHTTAAEVARAGRDSVLSTLNLRL